MKPNWKKVEDMTYELALQMCNYRPDFIVGISHGGWIPAILLSKISDWSLIPLNVAQMRDDVESFAFRDIYGKKILLVDDFIKTGKTFEVATKFLKEKNPADIKTACYFSRNYASFTPDFVYAKDVTFDVEFPWDEVRENFNLISWEE